MRSLQCKINKRYFVNVSALKIHMSENAHEAVMAFPEFITEFRGDICVKVNTELLFTVYYMHTEL